MQNSAPGEQRDADELAEPSGKGGSTPRQISITTGSTSGRSPERLRKNRCRSTRIFSLIKPGVGPFLDAGAVERRGQQRRDLLQQRLGPRVERRTRA